MSCTRLSFFVVFVGLLSGCTADVEQVSEQSAAVSDGTAEAFAILELVADPSTTFARLDDDVRLDRRAAQNIVDYRASDSIDSMAELDAISYVGESALGKLAAYVHDADLVRAPGDLLGEFEGVEFTVAQAERALALANTASVDALRFDVGLDKRAANGIIDARPLATIDQLADAYYVGSAMLRRLRDHATSSVVLVSDLDKTVIPPSSAEFPDSPYAGVSALYSHFEFGAYVTARDEDGVVGVPAWLESFGLPAGPIETGISGLPWIARDEKVADIEKVLDAHPDSQLILIGDTNHVDPDAFGDIIDLYPDRVRAAFVHDVKTIDAERLEGLFLFEDTADVAAELLRIGALEESDARAVMVSAQIDGLEITDAEIQALIDANQP